ncbi:MAG: hypothetical protein M3Q07_22780, partial [Pseudobdellovibrionaceae bacterium]|nr:hypothetical protein [Pseudobdellovibrionaceae bacterium]
MEDAKKGKNTINGYATIAILNVVTTVDVMTAYMEKYLPHMRVFMEKVLAAKAGFIDNGFLSLAECEILTTVALAESVDESVFENSSDTDTQAAKALEHLQKAGLIKKLERTFTAAGEILAANVPALESLARYLASKLNSRKQKAYTHLIIADCDDASMEEMLKDFKQIEALIAKLLEKRKPGRNKLALV